MRVQAAQDRVGCEAYLSLGVARVLRSDQRSDARERSRVPSHVGSMLYDNFRTWRRYGKWTASGTTWEQVWNKYED